MLALGNSGKGKTHIALALGLAGQVHFVGGPTEGYDTTNWWRSEQGCRRYLDEYGKLAYYLVKY